MAVMVMLETPPAVGVPLIIPVAGSKVSPVGKVPEVKLVGVLLASIV